MYNFHVFVLVHACINVCVRVHVRCVCLCLCLHAQTGWEDVRKVGWLVLGLEGARVGWKVGWLVGWKVLGLAGARVRRRKKHAF